MAVLFKKDRKFGGQLVQCRLSSMNIYFYINVWLTFSYSEWNLKLFMLGK